MPNQHIETGIAYVFQSNVKSLKIMLSQRAKLMNRVLCKIFELFLVRTHTQYVYVIFFRNGEGTKVFLIKNCIGGALLHNCAE